MRMAILSAACAAFLGSPVPPQKSVGGPILTNTTWNPMDNPHTVTSSLIVGSGATLTLLPGVELRFSPNLGLTVGSAAFGAGTLVAQGTAAAPVRFTSAQGMPKPGDWGPILFGDEAVDAVYSSSGTYVSGCVLEHCVVEYAGASGGAVTIRHSSPYVGLSVIQDNASTGVDAVMYSTANGVPPGLKISACTAQRNAGTGISISGNSGSPNGCSVTGGTVSYNTCCGISVTGGSGHYVSGVLVAANGSTGAGSGLYLLASVTVARNTVLGNTSSRGGGLYVGNFGVVNINGNIIADNRAYAGAGIFVDYYGSVNAMGNTVVDNRATTDGGGIWVDRSFSGSGNVICGNHAVQRGGGLFVNQGSTSVSGSPTTSNSLWGNTAAVGEAVYNNLRYSPNGSGDIPADYVCWGGPNALADPNLIWDYFDAASLGIVKATNPVVCDPLASLGAGTAGATGVPLLIGSGSLAPGSPATFALSSARPSAPGLLAVSAASSYLPFLGGLIVPSVGAPTDILVPLSIDASGAALVPIAAMPWAPAQFHLYLQSFVLDQAALGGIALSNGLLGVTP